MKLDKRIMGAVIGAGVLVLSLGGGLALAQQAALATPGASTVTTRHAAKPQAQSQGPMISPDQARAAAEAAHPRATTVEVELENENGVLVYGVELSNGLEVTVDAGNGQILHADQDGENGESGDQDDALEAPGAGDAPGQ